MTLLKLLLKSSGLSAQEAARYLDVAVDTVKSWSRGKNPTPDRALHELFELIEQLNSLADQFINALKAHIEENGEPAEIELPFFTDHHEARQAGFVSKAVHDAVLRRVVENIPEEWRELIVFKPKGSTLSLAAAECLLKN